MLGPRAAKRWPVRRLRVPKSTHLAFSPVIGMRACFPRRDQARRSSGSNRSTVSSSKSHTALGGRPFSFRTMAAFFLRHVGSPLVVEIARSLTHQVDPFHPLA